MKDHELAPTWPFQKMTTRFVAGETIEEAVAAIRELNGRMQRFI